MSAKILIVEDDHDLAALAADHLASEGYEVEVAHDGHSGQSRLREGGYDLLVLDIMLPGPDGLEICRDLRGRGDFTPVLMLTARSGEIDRIVGLEIGADDYLAKPVSLRELVARVRALLRRATRYTQGEESDKIQHGDLLIDVSKRTVTLTGAEVSLTAKEFDLLLHFARSPGRVYTRRELLDAVWGFDNVSYEHNVNSHINRLRAKIESDPAAPQWVLTVWGIGYKFREPGA